MANLLALESSAESCSVALSCSGRVALKLNQLPRQHAQLLLPMVDELLAEAELALSQLDAIAFSRGPGSFTGIRICMGVVQGLAFGLDLPVIPVSTLQALASAGQTSGLVTSGNLAATAFDARMNEIYFACYRITEDMPRLEGIESLQRLSNVASWLPPTEAIGLGSGWLQKPMSEHWVGLHYEHLTISAADIARIAAFEYTHGKAIAVHDSAPIYLRDEVTWKKREPKRRDQIGSQ